MSADFYVAVPAAAWPTMQELQKCFDERGWPVALGTKDSPNWDKPLQSEPTTAGLPVVFRGESIELEASFATLSSTESFAYTFDRPPDRSSEMSQTYVLRSDEILKLVDINETLAKIGASDVRFGDGDRILTLSFRTNKKEWDAGAFVMAALIKCFHGYGFELQTGAHGTSDYADDLVRGLRE